MASTNGISTEDIYAKKPGITTSTAIKGKNPNEMGMDEFFSLLTAQMTNQDMMNPEGNTEFIAQMAQFSSLQGIKQIQEYQLSSYASTYVGKDVTIANVTETGELQEIKGTVEKVTYFDGKPQVQVKGVKYDLHTVMEINAPNTAAQTSGNALSQATSYIGKEVTVTDATDPDNPQSVTGIVSGATLKGGMSYIMLGGKEYATSSITEVIDPSISNNPTAAENALRQASSYIGKYVTIRDESDASNTGHIDAGTVAGAFMKEGKSYVMFANGKQYPTSSIMSVVDPNSSGGTTTTPTEETPTGETGLDADENNGEA